MQAGLASSALAGGSSADAVPTNDNRPTASAAAANHLVFGMRQPPLAWRSVMGRGVTAQGSIELPKLPRLRTGRVHPNRRNRCITSAAHSLRSPVRPGQSFLTLTRARPSGIRNAHPAGLKDLHTMPKRPFRIGRSRTGLGLFATRPIRKGAKIAEYKGPLLKTKAAEI